MLKYAKNNFKLGVRYEMNQQKKMKVLLILGPIFKFFQRLFSFRVQKKAIIKVTDMLTKNKELMAYIGHETTLNAPTYFNHFAKNEKFTYGNHSKGFTLRFKSDFYILSENNRVYNAKILYIVHKKKVDILRIELFDNMQEKYLLTVYDKENPENITKFYEIEYGIQE